MTEEMIREITQAEEQATEKKQVALEQATAIVAQAQEQAQRMEQTSMEVCKAYRESQIKNAKVDAENKYAETLAQTEKSAKEYCADILRNADVAVSKIVERMISGNR